MGRGGCVGCEVDEACCEGNYDRNGEEVVEGAYDNVEEGYDGCGWVFGACG